MLLITDLDSKLKLKFQNRIWVDRNLEHQFKNKYSNVLSQLLRRDFFKRNYIIFVPLFLNCIMYLISKLRSFERCNFVNFFFEIFQPLTLFPLSFTSTSSILTTSNCSRLRGCSGSLMFLIKSKISRASTGSGMESSQSESVTQGEKHLNLHASKREPQNTYGPVT